MEEPLKVFNPATKPRNKKPKRISVKLVLVASLLVVVGAGSYVGYRLLNQSYADIGKASGLDWPSGVHAANELNPNLQFGNWRGKPIDVISTFTDRTSWTGLTSAQPFPLTWHKPFYQNKNHLYVISQPLYPSGQGNNAACAAGAYDANWKKFGQTLSGLGLNHQNTIIRLAWEFNGDFMYYRPAVPVNPTPDSVKPAFADWRNCWRKVSQAINATAPQVRMEWPLNSRGSLAYPLSRTGSRLAYNAYELYPGDDVVDIVGTNDYDHYPPANTTEANWEARCNKDLGWGACDVAKFARAHGKKFAVGEWGVKLCGESFGGDNAMHIRKMKELFSANRDIMAYESYYDDPGVGNACSALMRTNGNGQNATKSAAEYKKWFGAGSPCANGGCGPIKPSYPQSNNPTPPAPNPNPNPSPNPNPNPTTPQSYNKKLLLAPQDKRIYYVKDGKKSWLHNGALVGCISYRGAGSLIKGVSQTVINNFPNGDDDHCTYETEPGINFVRERSSPYVWLVKAGGTKLHVGIPCVPDAYTTPLKPFRIHVVPDGETAGHKKTGAFFGTPGLCGQLPH